MRSLPTLLLFTGTSLAACAIDGNVATPLPASAPAVDPDVARALSNLGLDARHTFTATRSLAGPGGARLVRVAQRYDGVPILGATATVRVGADGVTTVASDALARDVDVDITPRISDRDALAAVEATLRPTPYRTPAQVMLAILPERTSVRLTARRPGDLRDDATQYERRTTGYRLVYRVVTSEARPRRDQIALVDATTGDVISQRDAGRYFDNTAHTLFSGDQTIDVTVGGAGFELADPDHDDDSVFDVGGNSGDPWTHASSVWGDGEPFSPFTSRVTAGVDAYFGLEVTWRMYNRVFDWKGVGDDGTRVHAGVHDPSLPNNAHYSGFDVFDLAHELSFGDSTHAAGEMCAIDVVGHEYTHGVTASTAGLDGGEADGLNEGFSDIFGTLAKIYFKKSGFANVASSIPTTTSQSFYVLGTDVTENSSGLRNMITPKFRYFFDGIGDEEVHDADGPLDRAFFFLSQGADADVTSNAWSHGVPWGMDGIGNDEAGHTMFHALTSYVQSDDGYAQVRDRVIHSVTDLFVLFSPEEKAVRNAFAAIDVGDPEVGAPAAPEVTEVTGTHDSEATALAIGFSSTTPVPGLRKHDLTGFDRTGKDDFQVTLTCGESLGARLEQAGTYTLAAFAQGNSSAIATGTSDGNDLVLSVPSSTVCNAGTTTFFIRVLFQSAPAFVVPVYALHLDRHS